ncbi:MAG: anthranilate synthase component I [Candidatus Omnitrophica bacterium]|nr:anthranilate synthase component I [Candidatus Omnitrophota bacterium]
MKPTPVCPTLHDFRKLARKGNLIPVYLETSADLETPLSAYLKWKRGSYSYLLESVEGGEQLGRYSIVGSDPSAILESHGPWIRQWELPRTATAPLKLVNEWPTKKDPLYEIQQFLGKHAYVPMPDMPPFAGGLVGYMGYDMVRWFENLPDEPVDDLNAPDSVFMLSKNVLVYDRVRQRIRLVANALVPEVGRGVRSSRAIAEVYDTACKDLCSGLRRLQGPLPRPKSSAKRVKPRIRSNVKRDDFEENVRKIKSYIRAGEAIQVVYSQRFQTACSATPLEVYRSLRSLNPSPYMFLIEMGNKALVGSSPEVFLRVEGRRAMVRPIAGTRPRGKDEAGDKSLAQDLLKDPKERAEHLMLVDLGRNDLGRVCRYGSVHVPEWMAVERYSHVMHLVSECQGILKPGKTAYDAIRAAFPAGTVSGAPKVRAMEIIDELEQTKRGPYAGLVGYFSFSGNFDSCITLRTILMKDKKAYVQAGAGIVADSKPDREYEETVNKAKAMVRAIEAAHESA